MARSNKTTTKRIGIFLLIAVFGIAGLLPGWTLVNRVNSDEYWSVIYPELVQVDSGILDSMINDVESNNYRIYSILIIKDGFLIKEWYQIPYDKDIIFKR